MNPYDKFGRPHKDLYFMNLCFEIARRSIDPDTKHGCVAVTKEGKTLSTGYNGPPSGCNDDVIPLNRPDKYFAMEHSERNCIYSAAANGTSLKDSIFYITGLPCIDCLRGIMQVKAQKIIYGPLNSNMIIGKEIKKQYEILLNSHYLVIERFKFDKELLELNKGLKKIIDPNSDKLNMEFHNPYPYLKKALENF